MDKVELLKQLVNRFDSNIKEYKSNTYNEHSCRDEFINPFLEILGWDVANKKGLELVFIAKKWYNRRYEKRISSNKLRK